jgi:hypothetical protein
MGHMSLLSDECLPPKEKAKRKRNVSTSADPVVDDAASECSTPPASRSSDSNVDSASECGRQYHTHTSSSASMGSKSMSSFEGGMGRQASTSFHKRARTSVCVGYGSSVPEYTCSVDD